MGINLQQSSSNHPLFNTRIMRFLFIFIFGTICSVCYPLFSAKTFEDYIASFYVISSMIICLTIYSSIIWRVQKFQQFFTHLETSVQGSEFAFSFEITFSLKHLTRYKINLKKIVGKEAQEIYKKTNENVEFWNKAVYFLFVKLMTPLFMTPVFSISIFVYFTTDLGNDALKIPFPVW